MDDDARRLADLCERLERARPRRYRESGPPIATALDVLEELLSRIESLELAAADPEP